MRYTLNIGGRLLDLDRPRVMGIANVTPDSFYAGSRAETDEAVGRRVRQMVAEGADIIDVGACSTRPGSQPATEQQEMERLRRALPVVMAEACGRAVSVDTFRPDVARMAVEEMGVHIINDVGDPEGCGPDATPMMRMASRLGVPYVLTTTQPTVRLTLLEMARRVQQLRDMGQRDMVVDPGFGFGKSLDENFELLSHLEQLQALGLPVLVGMSRKRMVHQTLGCTADEALNGTTVLNTVALMKGASVLRVHDVRQAAECVKLYEATVCRGAAQTM